SEIEDGEALGSEARLGMACCAARGGRWSAWDQVFEGLDEAARASARAGAPRAAPMAWLAERAAGEALAMGSFVRAREALELSHALHEILGDEEGAERMLFLLEGLA